MDVSVISVPMQKGSIKGIDPWDGVLDEKGNCIFCGHSLKQHGALASMAYRPGSSRRVRTGLAYLHCRQCAADKCTAQVVCYKQPSGIRETAEALGFTWQGGDEED